MSETIQTTQLADHPPADATSQEPAEVLASLQSGVGALAARRRYPVIGWRRPGTHP